MAQENKHHVNESNRRSAVHSSYYAAFHYARQLAYGLEIDIDQQVADPRKNGRFLTSHQKLAHLLTTYGIANRDSKIKQIGMRLTSLHIKRCEADYDLELQDGFNNQQVGRHVLECIQLMQMHQPVKSN